jgi:hypothetical protein
VGVKVPKERDVQRAVLAFLRVKGACVVRVNSGLLPRADGGRMKLNDAPGCSDILGVYRGVGLALEVKGPGGKLTPPQAAFLDAWRAAGGVGAVVRGIPDAELVLADIEGRAG